MKTKLTITQIAEKAGVSIATVSRTLNDSDKVSPATKRAVEQAIRDLEFDSTLTRTVSLRRTLLVMLPDVRNPFYANIVDGIQQIAHDNSFEVFLLPTKDSIPNTAYLINLIRKQGFSGVLWLSSTPSAELLALCERQCPIVMCCEYPEDYDCSYVTIDDISSSYKAVNYLISTGCRKIGMVNCSAKYKYARHRRKGYLQALDEAGLEFNPEWYVTVPSIDYTLAYSSIQQAFSGKAMPDALFTCSDVLAAAAINCARHHGVSVPDELSVIGFDNVETSRLTRPLITTIAQPGYQMGQQACSILVEKIQNKGITEHQAERHILLSTELIIRDSTR